MSLRCWDSCRFGTWRRGFVVSLSFAFSPAFAFAFGFGTLHAVRVLQLALAVGAIACQPVWTDCCAWCGSVCWRRVEHRPRLVAAVFELLLIDQVLVDVIDECLVASLRVVWIPFAEACRLFFELLGVQHLRQ